MVEISRRPAQSKNMLILSVALKSVILFFSISSFVVTIVQAVLDRSGLIFSYFTVISNFLILVTTVVFLIADIGRYFGKAWYGGRLTFMIRFFAIIAITMTGCLFDFVLVPVGGIRLLDEYTSVGFHVIVPFLSMVDFILTNTVYKIRILDILLSLVYPICYLGMIVALSYSGVRWIDSTTGNVAGAPYPFLDYLENGWLDLDKGPYMGVFYWIWILLAVFLLLGFFYRFLQYVAKGRHYHLFR